jgi:hypothetical protein
MEIRPHRGMISNEHIKIGSESENRYILRPFIDKSKFYSGGLKAGDSYYYSVQTVLSSRLLSKNLKIKISNYNIASCAVRL